MKDFGWILRRTRNKLYVRVDNHVMFQPFHYNDVIVIDIDEVLGTQPFPSTGVPYDHGFAEIHGYEVGDVLMVSDGKGAEIGMKINLIGFDCMVGTREFVDGEVHIDSSYPDLEKYYPFHGDDIIRVVNKKKNLL